METIISLFRKQTFPRLDIKLPLKNLSTGSPLLLLPCAGTWPGHGHRLQSGQCPRTDSVLQEVMGTADTVDLGVLFGLGRGREPAGVDEAQHLSAALESTFVQLLLL